MRLLNKSDGGLKVYRDGGSWVVVPVGKDGRAASAGKMFQNRRYNGRTAAEIDALTQITATVRPDSGVWFSVEINGGLYTVEVDSGRTVLILDCAIVADYGINPAQLPSLICVDVHS